ncbi:MAG: flagellar biosynthesis protein FlhB [Oscillospiraceae bacterium]|nr:flagellar biosynthesis protein FlhB [Oscillospiraceae bacterium]
MGEGGGQEKTEKATPKKRKDAREKEGNVLQSKEISTAFFILLIFFTLFIVGRYMFDVWQLATYESFQRVGFERSLQIEDFMETARFVMRTFVLILAPLLAVGFLVPVLVSVVQTRGLFTMKPLRPKFSKLDPIKGAKRLFSMQTLVNVVKGMIVISAVMALVFFRVYGNMNDYYRLLDSMPQQGVLYAAQQIFALVMLIAMIIAFISIGDYIFQWWQYEKKLKMSKQEVKDEYKQIEGDPQIKSKIKQKQREIAGQRMLESVPDSDVIVRNPTHFAVAIKYDRKTSLSAPKVLAKGKDSLAQKIINIGEENEVYIAENRPLARELYDTVEVGDEVPPSLYNAIAIILTDMYTAKGITLDNPSVENADENNNSNNIK